MFRHPENLGNTDMRNLIHMKEFNFFSCTSFKTASGEIANYTGKKPVKNAKNKRHLFIKAENQHLSKLSLAFLFRLKLAKSKSFEENLNIEKYLKKMEESDSFGIPELLQINRENYSIK